VRGPLTLILWPLARLQDQRGGLFGWVPVCIGIGVGLWFALPVEPGAMAYAGCAAVFVALVVLAWFGPDLAQPIGIAGACLALGFLAAGVRVHLVAAPMLDFRYYGPVQGRIVEIDRSQSDAPRLTLDHVVLDDVAPDRTPARLRVSLHGDQHWLVPDPGQVVILTANLSAPEGPVEPGGFDFRRMAWFQGLGAVGYTRAPVLLWQGPEPGTQIINRLRTRLAGAIMGAIPGDAGAFAAGVMTGDRSGLSLDAVKALRDSSLAHLLAISGMNLAFLIGFTFALLRYGLALVPRVALRVNTKKVAAAVSLCIALFYLLLSGANVATERAFLMVTVMLGAVLLDRKALTLRSVALAGIVLLLWQPEALLDPGFQMSFAATIALIVGFRAMNARLAARKPGFLLREVMALVVSSLLGGVATAPFAAAHFNRYAVYGFVANLLTVPVMGAAVMPAGAVAALLAPLGLAGPALWVMEWGVRWILYVAHRAADIEGAVTAIVAPGWQVLPLISLGLLWGVLWQGRARVAGLLPVAVALCLWVATERPALLISSDGRMAGLATPQGRALSSPRGAGFAVKSWLENDGDLAIQETAALRDGFTAQGKDRRFEVGRIRGLLLVGKGASARLAQACATADLVILPEPATGAPPGCRVFDPSILRKTGPLAFYSRPDGLTAQPTLAARRLWVMPQAKGEPVAPVLRRITQIASDQ
jgi:competence protein ComEC